MNLHFFIVNRLLFLFYRYFYNNYTDFYIIFQVMSLKNYKKYVKKVDI